MAFPIKKNQSIELLQYHTVHINIFKQNFQLSLLLLKY